MHSSVASPMRKSSSSTSLSGCVGHAVPNLLSYVPLQNVLACGFPTEEIRDIGDSHMTKSRSTPSFENFVNEEDVYGDASCLASPPEIVEEIENIPLDKSVSLKRLNYPDVVERFLRRRKNTRRISIV